MIEGIKQRFNIRVADVNDAYDLARINVESWKVAYKGIVDSDYLDNMKIEDRHKRELEYFPTSVLIVPKVL